MGELLWVCWCHHRWVELTHAGGTQTLSLLLQAATGTSRPPCSHSPGFVSAQEAASVRCIPYAIFQQEVVRESTASFVTVVALNRKWLIFHDYFSVRHDSWENASVWLAGENEPALLSFKSKCSQALHANIPILDENSLAGWLMLCCQCISTKVNTSVLETSVSLISLAS